MILSEDITFCSTDCDRRDCRRNLKFYKPFSKYISVASLGEGDESNHHRECKYKLDL